MPRGDGTHNFWKLGGKRGLKTNNLVLSTNLYKLKYL